MDPEKKSLNFIFPTKYVIPKSVKFSHWPSKANLSRNFRDTPTLLLHSSKTEEMNHWYFLRKKNISDSIEIFAIEIQVSSRSGSITNHLPSLKLTFSPLKMDGWKMLEDNTFLLGFTLFSGAFAVSFRECLTTILLVRRMPSTNTLEFIMTSKR